MLPACEQKSPRTQQRQVSKLGAVAHSVVSMQKQYFSASIKIRALHEVKYANWVQRHAAGWAGGIRTHG